MKGFSLLETTVAVAILITAIVGPLTLASSSLRASSVAKNNLIAANLAQEGIELVRVKRSNNILQGKNWLDGFSNCFTFQGCVLEVVDIAISPCGSTCPPLNFDPARALYTYETGTPSIFARQIKLQNISANEVKIIVSLFWRDRFGNQQFELEEFMLNWQ